MKTGFFGLFFAGLVFAPVFATTTWVYTPPKPLEMVWGGANTGTNLTFYSPVAGGHTGARATSIGMSFSEVVANETIGAFPSSFPVDPDEIDWDRFIREQNSQAAISNGIAIVLAGVTNNAERILFIQNGIARFEFPLKDGRDPVKVEYQVGDRASQRPKHLYWTSAPFNAPTIALPRNFGCRLVGDTNLLWNASHTNQYGAADYDFGVHYSKESSTLQAYAKEMPDGTYRGPVGQLVLIYYDDGSCDRYLGHTVFDVSGPDPVYKRVTIGSQVTPVTAGYTAENRAFKAVIQSVQNNTGDADLRAPYFYTYEAETGKFHKQDRKVFAISETEPGNLGAKKAEIFWEEKDVIDVYWPFEQTCYHITWPRCLPVVIGRTDGDRGPGLTIPADYKPTLLAWQSYDNTLTDIVSLDESSGVLSFRRPGHFTLRLDNAAGDNFWFVPLRSVYFDDPGMFVDSVVEAPVGRRVECPSLFTLKNLGYPEDTLWAALNVSGRNPVYIHESASSAKVWNPYLYHFGRSGEDEFGALDSRVFPVTVAEDPAAVMNLWWSTSFTGDADELPAPLVFPVLPLKYRAVWPKAGEAPQIVIASQKGSGGYSRATGGRFAALNTGHCGGCWSNAIDRVEGGLTFSGWFNIGILSGSNACGPVSTGAVYTVSFDGTNGVAYSCRLAVESVGAAEVTYQATVAGAAAPGTVTLPRGEWTRFVFSASTNGQVGAWLNGRELLSRQLAPEESLSGAYFAIGDASGAGHSAAGLCIDDISIYGMATDDLGVSGASFEEAVGRGDGRRIHFEFEEPSVYDGLDDDGEVCKCVREGTGNGSPLRLTPYVAWPHNDGAPTWKNHVFPETGVAPRIYRQTDKERPGYQLNEEHAFLAIDRENGGYVAWALRNDLNTEDRPAYALVEYQDGDAAGMMAFQVVYTNEIYSGVESMKGVAGQSAPVFRPFDRLVQGVSSNTVTDVDDHDPAKRVAHRASDGVVYLRRDGTFYTQYVYMMDDAFDIPFADAGHERPEYAGWMNLMDRDPAGMSDAELVSALVDIGAVPKIYTDVSWPERSQGTLYIGQVLSKPTAGMPGVFDMKSCAVLYPNARDVGETNRLVKLIDPTVERRVAMPYMSGDLEQEYGFKVGQNATCRLKNHVYEFYGLPPTIGTRFFMRPDSEKGTGFGDLVFKGELVESAAEDPYLLVNSMSGFDRDALKSLVKEGTPGKLDWDTEVTALYEKCARDVEPSSHAGVTGTRSVPVDYLPADHYALVGTGDGVGKVVIIENDGPGCEALPKTLYVLDVTNELYSAPIKVYTDSMNKLSEQVEIYYSAGLGATADRFDFKWVKRDAPADGAVPRRPESFNAATPAGWTATSEEGTVARSGTSGDLKDLVNIYWTVHYTPKDIPENRRMREVLGADHLWSRWSKPTLAEGWVQRVLNALTPFTQRLEDFYENSAELQMTMPAQIGRPWNGDVALNNDNLTQVGLMELYRTILNRAESMSVLKPGYEASPAVCKQLLEAAARLVDFDLVLGGEAYSDAKNPLIGSSDGLRFPGTLFSFDNQVSSLLDEELCLLRGRSAAVAPAVTEYPFYNRLMWNYTKGITQGEAAYVNNYNIRSLEGVNTADTAAAMYPQGHGDAYGYYLSGVTEYLRLLRNPSFRWGNPAMMEMLVAQKVVNMDYQEEDKFAEAAYRLAKAGADAVDLTARKEWRDNPDNVRGGYFDRTNTVNGAGIPQAFGYGEFACRSGYGALLNWATVNSLLPANTNAAVRYFNDASINCITRGNCASLVPLAEQVKAVETKLNHVDMGLNPLGLSANAVPFDISPTKLRGDGHVSMQSHYEQIRERTAAALDNCDKALNYAQEFGSRIAAIENEQNDLQVEGQLMEFDYKKRLIAIYGTPHSGDIGPGKTYPQGYDGPDVYHFAYVNLSDYGLTNDVAFVCDFVSYTFLYTNETTGAWYDVAPEDMAGIHIKTNAEVRMSVTFTSDGLVSAPADIGVRSAEGTLQTAYRDFIAAYIRAKNDKANYEFALNEYRYQLHVAENELSRSSKIFDDLVSCYDKQQDSYKQIRLMTMHKIVDQSLMDIAEAIFNSLPSTDLIVGMANSLPIDSTIKRAGSFPYAATMSAGIAARGKFDAVACTAEYDVNYAAIVASLAQLGYDTFDRRKDVVQDLRNVISTAWDKYLEYEVSMSDLIAAQQVYRTRMKEAELLLQEREMMRRKYANKATTARYRDMYARLERNAALTKYSTVFDTAQRYVYELAKVYDYETGLLSSDRQSGDRFLAEIVGTRSLGTKETVAESARGDSGLWGVVRQMDANFAVLEGRLGINNPDKYTKWHSLRYSDFRIPQDASGDRAWRKELLKYWQDDVFADQKVARYCQPPAGDGAKGRIPGFVIPFATAVNFAENFFGRTLLGGEETYSSSDYATRIYSAGVAFDGYDSLVNPDGLAGSPNVYLVPTGRDYMRAPAGTDRKVISFNVIDQVLPLPYTIGSAELDDDDWISTFRGLDGTVDSFATIRRHSTIPVGDEYPISTRLVGRSVWNDGWLLVIPASSMHSDPEKAKELFLNGVKDIKLGFRTFSRSGN